MSTALRISQIEDTRIIAYEKRHDVDKNKFYSYVIEVRRASGTSLVFRRYKCTLI